MFPKDLVVQFGTCSKVFYWIIFPSWGKTKSVSNAFIHWSKSVCGGYEFGIRRRVWGDLQQFLFLNPNCTNVIPYIFLPKPLNHYPSIPRYLTLKSFAINLSTARPVFVYLFSSFLPSSHRLHSGFSQTRRNWQ